MFMYNIAIYMTKHIIYWQAMAEGKIVPMLLEFKTKVTHTKEI